MDINLRNALVGASQQLDSMVSGLTSLTDLGVNIEDICYQGFNVELIRQVAAVHLDASGIALIAAIGALRGSSKARSEDMIGSLSINWREAGQQNFVQTTLSKLFEGRIKMEKSQSGNLKSWDLTILRITHALPEFAVKGLSLIPESRMQSRVPTDLPPAMQFPAAAALPLTEAGVVAVKDFCVKFSALLKTKSADGSFTTGSFDEAIFEQQRSNEISITPYVVSLSKDPKYSRFIRGN